MHNPAIDKAEKLHGVKAMYMFDGKLRSAKEIRMLIRAAGSTITSDQIRVRLKNRFDTLEKMLRPLAKQASILYSKPERLHFALSTQAAPLSPPVDCVECGQESPLLFWRIGRHERYRCTRCQTIFEVEVK